MKLVPVLTIVLGSYIAIIHGLALFFELYWRYWWFDSIVHIFGGIFIVFILATLAATGWLSYRFGNSFNITITLGAIMIGWEIFGIILIGGLKESFFMDTSLDLFFGILGGMIGYRLITQLKKLES